MSVAGPLPAGRREQRARLIVGLVSAFGIIITVVGLAQPVTVATIGWFSEAPLAQETFVPTSAVVLHPVAALGLVIAASGAVLAAYLQGRRDGRRFD